MFVLIEPQNFIRILPNCVRLLHLN